MQSRKAFTLIELLVVIAIIAILAAILFPVFAQAKAQAKKIASVSNIKQHVLSELMYTNDSDDVLTPATAWGDPSTGYPVCFSAVDCAAGWDYLVLPYSKSGALFGDPQGPNQSVNDDVYLSPEYGFNYTYLSAWNGTAQIPVTTTSAARPADTVLIGNKWGESETNLNGDFVGFCFTVKNCDGPLLNYTIELPNCGNAPGYCATNWGINGFNSAQTYAAGNQTGGDAMRTAGLAVTSFIDGHAKTLSPGALTVGTNWSPTLQASALVFTNNWQSVYLWNGQ